MTETCHFRTKLQRSKKLFDYLTCFREELTEFQRIHFLQRGHVEKCKTWRIRNVTDFPAVRHVLGKRW